MDWLKSSLQAAQKQAQEAAEKARVYAQQASVQAKALAEQATEKAKVLAQQAAEEAQKLAATAATATSSGKASNTPSAEELQQYGVTDELVEHVGSLTYSTFSDYPVDSLPSVNPLGPDAVTTGAPGAFRLSPWQERHALLVLGKVEQLQHLRFALCPKRMTEQSFWTIYFTLCKSLLPPEAFGLPPAPGLGPSSSSGAAKEGTSSSAGGVSSSTTTGAVAGGKVDAAAGGAAASGATTSASPRGGGLDPDLDNTDLGGGGDEDPDLDNLEDLDDDLDKLVELENDPELAAYLQEALDLDEA
eukprot:CAMPEP_0202915834 /NCGR_PEP_ID=MMETSP1392-20130828/66833_1 /ASSEMBLY_ACC=CAM_ASM_000868 /TAXON_ID=225041 /ORGANISM="Chlamydomonas chlamydogama, Strain SAG 11-48b" /LENGTH=301 /DNA_ID=CAMNT_0049608019 /DNA_START=42 /DNA_END=944 /DNA_ORIENTATION=-